MTDSQLLTLGITIALSMSALIYSNSRIGDAKETLRAELKALSAELKSEMKDVRTELKAEIHELRADVTDLRKSIERMEDTLTRILADHDRRVSKLESKQS